MKIYITRHGQVSPRETILQNPDLPKKDPPLTELGIKQARLLGMRLRNEGFAGKIYSSPYRRALMTAQVIAGETGSRIYASHAIREIDKVSGTLIDFKGLAMEEILKQFPAAVPVELPYPWWRDEEESLLQVCDRAAPFIDEIIERNEDCLLVGHGASVYAANHVLLKYAGLRINDDIFKPAPFNCSLSEYHINGNEIKIVRYYDYSHIPLFMLSSNAAMALERSQSDHK